MIPHSEVIFTGPVDEFFDYRFGRLPYRSLRFQFETCNVEVAQQAPVINYPNENAYTRVTEFKYLTGQQHTKTTLVYEYPQAEGDPYYPVPRPENQQTYRKYQALADQTAGVHFLGRLGHLQVLQHGSVRGAGARVLPKGAGGGRRSGDDGVV